MKRVAQFAALTAALMAGAVAHAASTTASLSNFHFELIDLAPDDGIAPTMTLLSGSAIVSASLATVPGQGLDNVASNTSDGSDVLAHNQLATTGTVANWGNGALQAMGSAGANGEFSARSFVLSNFLLSANTQLVMVGDVSLASDFGFGSNLNKGFASATVELRGVYENGGLGEYAHYSRELNTFYSGPAARDDGFFLMFTNASDTALTGRLTMGVDATGFASTVPEPSAWLMLGAGAFVIAAAARRRARRAN